MCFGNATTGTSTTVPTPNPAVSAGGTTAIHQAEQLQSAGYTPYSGQRVADLTPLQQSGFNQASTAVDMNNPYVGTSAGDIQNYANAGPQSVNANPIYSQMAPYMNQYVGMALAPQIEAQNQQFAGQDQQLNAAATSSGA